MTNLNILNAKALEKQIKILETRIGEVQTELDGLEKMRTACLILLGNDVDFAPRPEPKTDTAAPVAKRPKPKKGTDEGRTTEPAESLEMSETTDANDASYEALPEAAAELTPEGAADAEL